MIRGVLKLLIATSDCGVDGDPVRRPPASASATVGAETRVGAFNVAGEVPVEPPQHETAGQHSGRAEDSRSQLWWPPMFPQTQDPGVGEQPHRHPDRRHVDHRRLQRRRDPPRRTNHRWCRATDHHPVPGGHRPHRHQHRLGGRHRVLHLGRGPPLPHRQRDTPGHPARHQHLDLADRRHPTQHPIHLDLQRFDRTGPVPQLLPLRRTGHRPTLERPRHPAPPPDTTATSTTPPNPTATSASTTAPTPPPSTPSPPPTPCRPPTTRPTSTPTPTPATTPSPRPTPPDSWYPSTTAAGSSMPDGARG